MQYDVQYLSSNKKNDNEFFSIFNSLYIISMNDDLLAAVQASYMRLSSQFPDSTVFRQPGTRIKDFYHIGHRLDESKKSLLSEVRVCTNRSSQLRFAVKTYYLGDGHESSTDIIFTKRKGLKFSLILNEIQTQLLLNHPNICKIHDVFLDSKYLHIVLDHCKGGEIYDYLANNKPMTVQESFPLFFQLLDALDYMRSQGIVHRAICIENIMFYDVERTSVKIISFSSASIGDRFTEKYGCALYMAPEVFEGLYDSRCDIWSLGVAFYCMVVGFQPFQGKTVNDILKKVKKPRLPKNQIWKKLPKTLKSLIKNMLVKEQNRPFAEELLESKYILKFMSQMPEFVLFNVLKSLKKIVPTEEYMVKVQFANKIKRKVVKVLESKRLLPNLQFLEAVWNKLDKQQLKVITVQAMETFFSSLPQDYQPYQARFFEVFHRYDSNKNNTISYLDYLTTLSILANRNLIIKVFEIIDENSVGIIGIEELFSDDNNHTEREVFVKMYLDAVGKDTLNKEDLISLLIKFSS